ncbi:MAG: LPS-assembly protein LptD [Candidatus Rokubacteria bacterium]|nr:LPS-assembly protein LptD [Candidatus Rokubacteria bacterium]
MTASTRALALAAGLLLGVVSAAAAQPRSATVPTVGGDVSVLADRIEDLGRDGLVVATGNVEIVRGRARLTADRVEINRESGGAVATGRVVFYDGEDRLTGDRIDYNIRSGTGVVHHGAAQTAPYYRLSGERMERLGGSVYRVRRGIFTTCEDDPPAWSFRFEEATADLEDYVYGTGASFWVKDIPLIPFFPFFAAAIRRERQTGFLFPVLGSSSRKGFYAEIPFFWAIDESQDLTAAFHVYEDLGVGGRAQYRYRLSESHGGALGGFYVRETQLNDDDRGWGSLRHEWARPGWRAVADVNMVSDDFVLREYSTRLSERTLQRVDSNVFVTRSFEHWNLVGSVFSYQDLTTPRGTELRRLPELRADRIRAPVPGLPGLLFDFESSATYFQRDIGADGSRIDLHPRLSAPIRPGGLVTVTPFLGARLTAYDRVSRGRRRSADGLTEVDVFGHDARVRRYVEAGGAVEAPFSRVYGFDRWGVDALLHRVEPRVSYVYVTGDEMTRLPLYTERIDRVEEGSKVIYSLTNRVLARTAGGPDGEAVRWEAVRLMVGHEVDLRSRNHTVGDLIGDLIVQAPSIFRARAEARYNTSREDLATVTTDAAITLERFTGSVGTRFDAEQRANFLQGGLRAELTRHVVAHAATNWDMRTDTFVETQYGLDLRFQCYELSVVYIDRGREVGRNRGEDELRFSVNLLGLGGPLRTGIGP